MFHSFFNFLARSRYLSFFSLFFFSFTLWSAGKAKSTIWQVLFSCCVPRFFRTDFRLCKYHLFLWSNLNFLHNSRWMTLATQSYIVLYSFFTNMLHLLIMWLIVSSRSPHNLHLLFCCVLSILSYFDIIGPYGVV